MVVNPILAFLINRNAESVSLSGIIVDTIITSIVMTWLVTVFSAADINRQLLRAGRFKNENLPKSGPVLSRLPRKGTLLGAALFICTVLVMVTLTVSVFYLFGITELSVDRLALFKLIYTGPVAYVVARLAIIRQLGS
ncbi:MAG: hypothetical protein PHH67_07180 [Methanosarcina sp.]|jgi:hypothetical protein|nr:hypothetical protein [Methanosarcina sp.]MDD3317815.1 hypothetical protein [Methanosarcina sp.]MDD4306279.1 hypothetical protein [Methanosarcina sp.]MDD4620698.1 hypothetical protein [Methanosarcina sp.]NLN43066.1 hypothetical protein [Methanosarcina sp.]